MNESISWKTRLHNPGLTNECLSSVEMLKRSQFRFGLNPKDIGADSAYKISQVMRRGIERLFEEAKEQMGLRRARRRGLEHVHEQFLMTAMAQNIKRIVKLSSPKVLSPAKLRLSYSIWVDLRALLACFR